MVCMVYIREEMQDNLSEWLRRQTRNLLGFARAGSNPAVVEFLLFLYSLFCIDMMKSGKEILLFSYFS